MRKGIILAGGAGTRLAPLTLTTNKHLLPIHNKQMILYPLDTLIKCECTSIMIVLSNLNIAEIVKLVNSYVESQKISVYFVYQNNNKGGIAHALSLCKDFVNNDKFILMLGDNILLNENIKDNIDDFFINRDKYAEIFIKNVPNPEHFGVAQIIDNKLVNIIEKPIIHISNYAVIGLYLYDASVFKIISQLKKSDRGEYEITDVNDMYINSDKLTYIILDDNVIWLDAGTFKSLNEANNIIYNL